MRPQVGQVINNKYRLVRLIGDGGMGSVYEAKHEVLGTTVALKFLHPELSRRGGLVQRFLQEARVSAAIQSPHVVRVSDVDQTSNGLAYIVLEYLEGRTLQTLYEDLYRAKQRLGYGDALEYTMQMLEGVEAAHAAGIVHRDLKPDNVMITKGLKGEPVIKILDFGIAKLKVSGELDKGLTRPGVMMGTPEYMAPEQAYSADAVDGRADIFSLGVMIFEMLAGRRPVGGDEAHQIAAQYLAGQVARLSDLAPNVPAPLAEAVHRAMAAQAKDRFDTVADLRAAIEPYAQSSKPAPTPAPSSVISRESAPSVPAPVVASTNPPEEDGYRAVPKTLPPEGEPPTVPADPIAVDAFAARGTAATPLGGFQAAASAHGQGSTPPDQTNITANPSAHGGGEGYPATAFGDAPRPGGTALGGPPAFDGVSPYGAAPTPYGGGGTALDGSFPAPMPSPKAKRSGIASFFLILLLAGTVAGAVVGGVYAAQEYSKREDHTDDPPKATPPPVATLAPPPPSADPAVPTAPPVPPPPTQNAKPPATPPHPNPNQPAPSAHPSAKPPIDIPPLGQPFVIPSTLPALPFPGFTPQSQPQTPPAQPQPPTQPPSQPTQPPTQPQPDPPTRPARPPVIFHFPKRGASHFHIVIRRR